MQSKTSIVEGKTLLQEVREVVIPFGHVLLFDGEETFFQSLRMYNKWYKHEPKYTLLGVAENTETRYLLTNQTNNNTYENKINRSGRPSPR